MNRRYKIILIAVFPFLLFFSVKSMNNSLSKPESNEIHPPVPHYYSQPGVQPSNNTIPVQLTHYSQP